MWSSIILILSYLASQAAAASNVTQNSVCSQLAAELASQVFLPDAPTYDATISSYPFIQLRLHPSCVVRPRSAKDVATALQIIQTDNSTRFAVKGGGHNANAGFNNVENGVTIDMQSMKTVEIARGDQVVRVEAGALSQDAYDAAEKRNLTVLAGRIGVVGTAGFLTGGMSILHGLRLHAGPQTDLCPYQVAYHSSRRNMAGHATLLSTSKSCFLMAGS
jgi:nitrogen regulatory protein PII